LLMTCCHLSIQFRKLSSRLPGLELLGLFCQWPHPSRHRRALLKDPLEGQRFGQTQSSGMERPSRLCNEEIDRTARTRQGNTRTNKDKSPQFNRRLLLFAKRVFEVKFQRKAADREHSGVQTLRRSLPSSHETHPS
jgi:hypothetical protein